MRVRLRPRAVAFWSGAAVVVGTVAPPMEAVAGQTFTGHMVQHLMLFVAGPLLLVAGDGAGRMRRSVPAGAARRAVKVEYRMSERSWLLLASALVLHGAVIGAWHVPPWYDAAVRAPAVHLFEHATMLGAGLWFWWTAVVGARRNQAGAVVTVFLAALQMGAVAALLTWSPDALYAREGMSTGALTPLGDQQVGAAVMWTAGGAAYVLAGVGLFARWLAAEERRSQLVGALPWAIETAVTPPRGPTPSRRSGV